jgi:hypothetical protein
MQDNRTIGERARSHQRWTKAMHKLSGGPYLVVDNTCRKRDHSRGIRGARLIYGGGDGPDAA